MQYRCFASQLRASDPLRPFGTLRKWQHGRIATLRLLPTNDSVVKQQPKWQTGAQVRAAHWRGAGPSPSVGSDGGVFQCPPALGLVAIRAGHLFNSTTGRMLTRQVVIILGDRITDVGPDTQVKIPAGAKVIDLSHATVLPDLIDAHAHMFNDRRPDETTEASVLIAAQSAAADLRAGFTSARDLSTHGNGFSDLAIRAAINDGRIPGPRYQVSTRGIEWSGKPQDPARPDNWSAPWMMACRRARPDLPRHWIKLYPAINYSFSPHWRAQLHTYLPHARPAGVDR
jgi:Amidohydrolase family